jgi:hypothetical protein
LTLETGGAAFDSVAEINDFQSDSA